MRFKSMLYKNDHLLRSKKKESLYDYHKIQSTQNDSQKFGQRHHLFGGPSSGHQQYLNQTIDVQKFTSTSPTPAKTFDDVRGASPEMNSYNNLHQYMAHQKEFPRLTVL